MNVSLAQSSDLIALRIMAKAYQEELASYYPEDALVPKQDADAWFQQEPPALFVIRECGSIAGFAVIVLSGQSLDKRIRGHYFAELYVVPRFRKSQLPMQACAKIARTYPGVWTADALEANITGLCFMCAMAKLVSATKSKPFDLDIVDTPAGGAWRCQFVVRG